jgi:hypothetical protein
VIPLCFRSPDGPGSGAADKVAECWRVRSQSIGRDVYSCGLAIAR